MEHLGPLDFCAQTVECGVCEGCREDITDEVRVALTERHVAHVGVGVEAHVEDEREGKALKS